jgi:hypothetical protein
MSSSCGGALHAHMMYRTKKTGGKLGAKITFPVKKSVEFVKLVRLDMFCNIISVAL